MKTILGLAGAFLLTSGVAIAAETIVPVPPVPGSVATTVFAINDNNIVAGSYTTPDGKEHGFFGTLDGAYTTFDSKFRNTQARSINNAGVVMGVGYGRKTSLAFERYPDGSIAYVSKGGEPVPVGIAGGINAHGVFVASGYDQALAKPIAFYGKNAKYKKSLALPGTLSPDPRGINDSGDVAGFFQDEQSGLHGFLLKDDAVTTIDHPDSIGTFVYGIDNADRVVGFYGDQNQRPHAFVYDPASQQFTAIVEKHTENGKYAVAYGMNNEGLVAVNFVPADGPAIYCPRKASQCPSAAKAVRATSVANQTPR